jgi:energy-coupling factor transporter ATP-binding protein EcfA2
MLEDLNLNVEDLKGKKILICGKPTSGKTTLARKLSELSGSDIIHTDDYKDNFEQAPYKIIQDAKKKPHSIIEGVQSPRVLKYGILGGYIPDIIIHLDNSKPVNNKHKGLATLNDLSRIKQWARDVDIKQLKDHF